MRYFSVVTGVGSLSTVDAINAPSTDIKASTSQGDKWVRLNVQ
jgi:hypothetical protein